MSARSKQQERRVATFFGTLRTPLSGGASRHTRSDTLHPDLYVEVKSAIGPGGTNGWLFRWLKRLDWPQDIVFCGSFNGLYLVPSRILKENVRYGTHQASGAPVGCLNLWCGYGDSHQNWHDGVVHLAAQEEKVPLLALLVKGKRGFWLVSDAEGILEAQKARKETV